MPPLLCFSRIQNNPKFFTYFGNFPTKKTFLNKLGSDASKNDNSSAQNTKTINKNTSLSKDSDKDSKEIKKSHLEPPEEPSTCCMSGCANCVWLEYAEALSRYYQDGGAQAIRDINERISDPNIKAYLLHEIRMMNKK